MPSLALGDLGVLSHLALRTMVVSPLYILQSSCDLPSLCSSQWSLSHNPGVWIHSSCHPDSLLFKFLELVVLLLLIIPGFYYIRCNANNVLTKLNIKDDLNTFRKLKNSSH